MDSLAERVLDKVKSWLEEGRRKKYSLDDSCSELLSELEIMIIQDEKDEKRTASS